MGFSTRLPVSPQKTPQPKTPRFISSTARRQINILIPASRMSCEPQQRIGAYTPLSNLGQKYGRRCPQRVM